MTEPNETPGGRMTTHPAPTRGYDDDDLDNALELLRSPLYERHGEAIDERPLVAAILDLQRRRAIDREQFSENRDVRVPPDRIWVQWARGHAFVKRSGSFAVLQGANGCYERVRTPLELHSPTSDHNVRPDDTKPREPGAAVLDSSETYDEYSVAAIEKAMDDAGAEEESHPADFIRELHAKLQAATVREPSAPHPDVCWHCLDVLQPRPRPRCERCPSECDEEGCPEPGCNGERVVDLLLANETLSRSNAALGARVAELHAELAALRARTVALDVAAYLANAVLYDAQPVRQKLFAREFFAAMRRPASLSSQVESMAMRFDSSYRTVISRAILRGIDSEARRINTAYSLTGDLIDAAADEVIAALSHTKSQTAKRQRMNDEPAARAGEPGWLKQELLLTLAQVTPEMRQQVADHPSGFLRTAANATEQETENVRPADAVPLGVPADGPGRAAADVSERGDVVLGPIDPRGEPPEAARFRKFILEQKERRFRAMPLEPDPTAALRAELVQMIDALRREVDGLKAERVTREDGRQV